MKSSYPQMQVNKTPGKMSVREAARVRATDVKRSHYGEAILEKNPVAGRELQQTLNILERNKKCKAQETFWKQRQFFIERAFNQDKQLRFVHLKEKTQHTKQPKDGKPFLPPINQCDTSLTSRLFPSSFSEEEKRNSNNFRRIEISKQKFQAAIKSWQPVVKWNGTVLKNRKNDTSVNDDSMNDDAIEGDSVSESIFKEGLGTHDPSSVFNKSSTGFKGKQRDIIQVRVEDFSSKKDTGFEKCPRKELKLYNPSQNLSLENSCNSFLVDKKNGSCTDIDKSDNASPTFLTETYRSELNNKTQQLLDEILTDRGSCCTPNNTSNPSSVGSTVDELLLKITMSLPAGMFGKTSDTLGNLSTVLGFDKRNELFKEREKTFASKPVLQDERFKRLQGALIQPRAQFRNNKCYEFQF